MLLFQVELVSSKLDIFYFIYYFTKATGNLLVSRQWRPWSTMAMLVGRKLTQSLFLLDVLIICQLPCGFAVCI